MSLAQIEQTITSTESELDASVTGSRLFLMIRNLGPSPIFVGATGVTADTGLPIQAGETRQWDENVQGFAGEAVFAITRAGEARVRVLEAS